MKSLSTKTLRGAFLALVMLGFFPIIIPLVRAQSTPASADTNSASSAVTTNSALANAAPPPVTSSAAADQATNSAPISPTASTDTTTPAANTGDTNAPAADMASPGATAAPATELIGPPAPGSASAPVAGSPGSEGAMPGNNPAVTDVTNNPGAVAGLGQRKLPFYFGLDLGEMYDDNIFISPNGEKKSSFITHVSPSLDYQRGDQTAPNANYLNLYFAPTVFIYHDQDNINRIDYNGDIYYQHNWTRLSLGIEQNYQHLTDSTLDEGTLVSRNIYTTKLIADYLYNDDLTLYGTGTQQINSYPGITINEWDIDTYALYQIAPKLSIGAGPRFAFLDITGAPNEAHQDLLARLRYVPDSHFVVSFEGGVEYLEYQGDQASRLLPIFDTNITYMPFNDTSLFVEAGRSTENSYDLQGDTIDYSSVDIGASQVFLRNFKATVTGGYNNSSYQQTSGPQGASSREDDYFIAKGSVQWTPNQWLEVEGSYQWSNNNSSTSQFTFTDNQVDIQSTVKF